MVIRYLSGLIMVLLIGVFAMVPGATIAQPGATPEVERVLIGQGVELVWYELIPDESFPLLIGEIHNPSDAPVAAPYLNIAFSDDAGNVYGTTTTTPILPVIEAGESMGFMAHISDVDEGWTTAQFIACSYSYDFDPNATANLTVTDVEVRERERGSGFYTVSGWVENGNLQAVPYVAVIIPAYDPQNGRFIGWGWDVISTEVPGERRAAFDASFAPTLDLPGWIEDMEPEFRPTALVSVVSGGGSC